MQILKSEPLNIWLLSKSNYIQKVDFTMWLQRRYMFQLFLLFGLLLQVKSRWTRWGSWSSCTNLRQTRERTNLQRQTRRCLGIFILEFLRNL